MRKGHGAPCPVGAHMSCTIWVAITAASHGISGRTAGVVVTDRGRRRRASEQRRRGTRRGRETILSQPNLCGSSIYAQLRKEGVWGGVSS